jgi:YegS/Rv2252/BmrU family lipid kinase
MMHGLDFFPGSSPLKSLSDRPAPSARGRRALLLINPRSRRGPEQGDRLAASLRQRDLEVEIVAPAHRWGFRDAIREHASRIDMVIMAGGDGTLHLAADALVGSGLPLGVVPLGTANDLASSLDIPTSIEDACDVIARGNVTSIDLGWVNGAYFFNAANIGFAVELTRRLSASTKGRWGVAGYGLAALEALRARRAFDAEIVHQGRTIGLRSMHITVGNGRYHGGAITVAENAALDDHLLHLYSVRPVGVMGLLGVLPVLRRGEQRASEKVDTLDALAFEIRTERPMRIIADGELTTHTPARFRLLPDALSVFAPGQPVRGSDDAAG